MRIKEIKLYKFDELSEQAKEKAIDWYRRASEGDNFYAECVIDDAKEIGKILGINIDNVYYSGFWSQGDGACFEGYYSYAKGSVKKLKAYAPQDSELHRIATGLAELQKHHGYKLTARVKHRGHYYHEMCTEIDVGLSDSHKETSNDTDDAIKDLLRDFMRWIYKCLESDYEYQNADEQVIESIQANEYEFEENGKVA